MFKFLISTLNSNLKNQLCNKIKKSMKKVFVVLAIAMISLSVQAQDFSALYKRMSPSVVTIVVKESHMEADRTSMTKHMVTSGGLGSGVLISEKGEIWTANHVVVTAEEVNVHFQSGEVVPAKVITNSASADLAMIKLLWMPKEYAVAKIGVSKDVKIGNEIFIIGAPFGLERSLSVGYISGRIDDAGDNSNFEKSEYFQTDASINHGNSGGPMFNTKGEVIGIVSSILSQSGGFDGIGFVITSDIATLHLMGDQPFWYGAEFMPITGELRSIFNLSQDMGLLVQKVAAGSPSALSGLKPGIFKTNIEGKEFLTGGDIIIKVGDILIEPKMDMDKINSYLTEIQQGGTFKITVLRAGEEVVLTGIVPIK